MRLVSVARAGHGGALVVSAVCVGVRAGGVRAPRLGCGRAQGVDVSLFGGASLVRGLLLVRAPHAVGDGGDPGLEPGPAVGVERPLKAHHAVTVVVEPQEPVGALAHEALFGGLVSGCDLRGRGPLADGVGPLARSGRHQLAPCLVADVGSGDGFGLVGIDVPAGQRAGHRGLCGDDLGLAGGAPRSAAGHACVADQRVGHAGVAHRSGRPLRLRHCDEAPLVCDGLVDEALHMGDQRHQPRRRQLPQSRVRQHLKSHGTTLERGCDINASQSLSPLSNISHYS